MPSFSQLSAPRLDRCQRISKHPELAPASAAEVNAGSPGPVDPISAHYRSSFGFMFADSGLPVIAPPWTSLTAYNLNTGAIRWKIPLGVVPELAARGFTSTGSQFPKVSPVVTAGGLIFAGTRDRKVRAIDSDTGKVLWEAEVDAALEGMPAIYEVQGTGVCCLLRGCASHHLHAQCSWSCGVSSSHPRRLCCVSRFPRR